MNSVLNKLKVTFTMFILNFSTETQAEMYIRFFSAFFSVSVLVKVTLNPAINPNICNTSNVTEVNFLLC